MLSVSGRLLGIVTSREGGLEEELYRSLKATDSLGKNLNTVTDTVPTNTGIVEINDAQILRQTVSGLNKYISTGIGYAAVPAELRAYVLRHDLQ